MALPASARNWAHKKGSDAVKMIKAAAAAAFFCIVSTAAGAADYQYLNGQTDSHWRTDLLAWLAKNKPDPANVSIGITPDGDIHAYAVPGQFPGIYSIQRLHHPADRANSAFRSVLDGGTGKIIGFRHRKHASDQPPEGGTPPAEGQGEHPRRGQGRRSSTSTS